MSNLKDNNEVWPETEINEPTNASSSSTAVFYFSIIFFYNIVSHPIDQERIHGMWSNDSGMDGKYLLLDHRKYPKELPWYFCFAQFSLSFCIDFSHTSLLFINSSMNSLIFFFHIFRDINT